MGERKLLFELLTCWSWESKRKSQKHFQFGLLVVLHALWLFWLFYTICFILSIEFDNKIIKTDDTWFIIIIIFIFTFILFMCITFIGMKYIYVVNCNWITIPDRYGDNDKNPKEIVLYSHQGLDTIHISKQIHSLPFNAVLYSNWLLLV